MAINDTERRWIQP